MRPSVVGAGSWPGVNASRPAVGAVRNAVELAAWNATIYGRLSPAVLPLILPT